MYAGANHDEEALYDDPLYEEPNITLALKPPLFYTDKAEAPALLQRLRMIERSTMSLCSVVSATTEGASLQAIGSKTPNP